MMNDVSNAFKDKEEEYEVRYENIQLSPLLFLDDILRCSDTVQSANYGNKLLEKVISEKGLEFNTEKSMFIVMGNKKARKVLKSELENLLFFSMDQR